MTRAGKGRWVAAGLSGLLLTGALAACTPAGGGATPSGGGSSSDCSDEPAAAEIGDAPILYSSTVNGQTSVVLYEDGVIVTFFPEAFVPGSDSAASEATTAGFTTANVTNTAQVTTAQVAPQDRPRLGGDYPRAPMLAKPDWPVISAVSECVLEEFADLAADLSEVASRTDGDLGTVNVTDQSSTRVSYGVEDPFSVGIYGLGIEREYPQGLSREELRGREVVLEMAALLRDRAGSVALLPIEQVTGVEVSTYSGEFIEVDETWPLGPLADILDQREGTCGLVTGDDAGLLLAALDADDVDVPSQVTLRVLVPGMDACQTQS